MNLIFLTFISLLNILYTFVLSLGVNEEFQWNKISYNLPQNDEYVIVSSNSSQILSNVRATDKIIFDGATNEANRQNKTLKIIDYQYENNIPFGANLWNNKIFITIPRRRPGVPSTLNYIPLNSNDRTNVPLIPYPNLEINYLYPIETVINRNNNNNKNIIENIVSVYRIAIDVCDRMWFVDTGIAEYVGNRIKIKPHELIIIDLKTDQIIHRYSIPDSILTSATTLAAVTVDVAKDDCNNAYAYFPDLAGFGLVVYSYKQNHAWRVKHNYFYLENTAGEFFIGGFHFQWSDGVFSVELSDKKSNGLRDLYFHSMAGTNIYKVSTGILKNESLATRSYHGNDFEIIGNRGTNSQTSTADLHKSSGLMFLALVNQNALGCWNINKSLNTISIVHRDDNKFIYPSDVKIFNDKVIVLSNSMPIFLYGHLNYEQYNFRIWINNIYDAVKGTTCE